MTSIYTILFLSLLFSLALTLNLLPVENLNMALETTLPFPPNRSLATGPHYTCTGGSQYGDTIPRSSCRDAAKNILERLPYSHREELTFGDRRIASGRGVSVELPYMSISRT